MFNFLKKTKIKAYFVTQTGYIKELKLKDIYDTTEFNNGVYIFDRDKKYLDKKNIPTWLFIEGISEPIRLSATPLKITSDNLKKILRAKLFNELLEGDNKILDLIINIIIVLNFIITVVVSLKLFGAIK